MENLFEIINRHPVVNKYCIPKFIKFFNKIFDNIPKNNYAFVVICFIKKFMRLNGPKNTQQCHLEHAGR